MFTKILTSKKIKVSSKGQITFTLPKKFLEKIEIQNGDELVVEFLENEIKVFSQQQVFREKIKHFKPISVGKGIVTNIAETHNDIYDN